MPFQDKLCSEYLPKIFGYAVNRTKTLQEAEDLSQEILLRLLRSLKSNPEPDCPDTWVWMIARRVYIDKIRSDSGRREIFGIPENAVSRYQSPDEICELNTDLQRLRKELSFLTKTRREIAVLYYLDELTVNEIAARLNLPSGTVKWHLCKTRDELKRGMTTVRTPGEKSYRPGRLALGIQGQVGKKGEPFDKIERLLDQNIMMAAYEKPVTAAELAEELGISAPYMEDEAEHLVLSELMVKANNKYVTNFPIAGDEIRSKIERLAEEKSVTFCSTVINNIISLQPKLRKTGFFGSEFLSDSFLMWLYVPLSFNFCWDWIRQKYSLPTFDDYPDRPDNGRWYATGYSFKESEIEFNQKFKYNGPLLDYDNNIGLWMADCNFSQNRIGLNKNKSIFGTIQNCFSLPFQINADDLAEKDKECMAKAVETGMYRKIDDVYTRFIPTFDSRQIAEIESVFEEIKDSYVEVMEKMIEKCGEAIQDVVPDRLGIQKKLFAVSLAGILLPAALCKAVETGMMKPPEGKDQNVMTSYIKI